LLLSPARPMPVAESPSSTPAVSSAPVVTATKSSNVTTVKPEVVEEAPKAPAVDRLELDPPKLASTPVAKPAPAVVVPAPVIAKPAPVVAAPVAEKETPVEVVLSQQRIVSESVKTEKQVASSESLPEKTAHQAPVKAAKVEPLEVRETAKPAPSTRSVVASRWPLAGNWIKHHGITFDQLQELNRGKGNQYTIQLMSDPWRLREPFTGRAEQMLDQLAPEQVFVSDYVLADGRPRIALLYGVYATREEAMQAVSRMPTSVQKNTPVILSLNRMIEQMRTSDAYSRSE